VICRRSLGDICKLGTAAAAAAAVVATAAASVGIYIAAKDNVQPDTLLARLRWQRQLPILLLPLLLLLLPPAVPFATLAAAPQVGHHNQINQI
jgi:hypothetical protein